MNSKQRKLVFLGCLWMGIGFFLFTTAHSIALQMPFLRMQIVYAIGIVLGIMQSILLVKVARKKVDLLQTKNVSWIRFVQPQIMVLMISLGMLLRLLDLSTLRATFLLMVSIALTRASFVYFRAYFDFSFEQN